MNLMLKDGKIEALDIQVEAMKQEIDFYLEEHWSKMEESYALERTLLERRGISVPYVEETRKEIDVFLKERAVLLCNLSRTSLPVFGAIESVLEDYDAYRGKALPLEA